VNGQRERVFFPLRCVNFTFFLLFLFGLLKNDIPQLSRNCARYIRELVKREMALLADVDKPGSAIDVYVERLAEVLAQKAASIAALQDRVAQFQAHLKEEEILSRTVGLH
jgi:hypothetical protein